MLEGHGNAKSGEKATTDVYIIEETKVVEHDAKLADEYCH